MPGNLCRIFAVSCRYCLRQPVYLILQLATFSAVGLQPVLAQFAFREQQKLVTDGALASIMIGGLLMAVLCANGIITRDIEQGTAQLILSKPVARSDFVVGKLLALLLVSLLFVWVNGVGALASIHIAREDLEPDRILMAWYFGIVVIACVAGALVNLLTRCSFPLWTMIIFTVMTTIMGAVVLKNGASSGGLATGTIRALLLLGIAVWLMALVAATIALRMALVSNLFLTSAVFLTGLISDYLYAVVTRIGHTDMARALANPAAIGFAFVIAGWIILAVFQHLRRRPAGASDTAAIERPGPAALPIPPTVVLHVACAVAAAFFAVRMVTAPAFEPVLPRDGHWAFVIAGSMVQIKDCAATVLHTIIPNWQLFWLADAIVAKQLIPGHYLGCAALYFLLFFIAATTVMVLMFERVDLTQRRA